MEDKEAFLTRWSRLKEQGAKQEIAKAEEVKASAKPQDLPPPELPPVEKLDINANFSGFLRPEVKEELRRAALKKLFDDPHFHFENMDKLDVYIDDYSKLDLIPPDMLAQLMESNPLLFPPKDDASSGQKNLENNSEIQPGKEEKSLESKAQTTPEVVANESANKPESSVSKTKCTK
jgi:hypothetical protein